MEKIQKITLYLTFKQTEVVREALQEMVSTLFRELHMENQPEDINLSERDSMVRKEYIANSLLDLIHEQIETETDWPRPS